MGALALAVAKIGTTARVAEAAGDTPPQPTPFSATNVNAEAKRLADQPFAKPSLDLPPPFNKLTYDQYRDIRFRSEKAI